MPNANYSQYSLLPGMQPVRMFALLAAVVLIAAARPSLAQINGELNIVLKSGMAIQDLYVTVPVVNNAAAARGWACQGAAPASNSSPCAIKQFSISGSGIQLSLDIFLDGSSPDLFSCNMSKNASGGISGTYGGSYAGIPISGAVSGTLVPFVPSYLPMKTGEHPVLLFRSSQIPYIKGRAATAQGQKMINAMKAMLPWDEKGFSWGYGEGRTAPQYCEGQWAAAHAFLYTLTGNKSDLQRAKEITTVAMMTRGGEMGGWGDASRWAGVALAYDMCYYGWDKEFRNQVYFFLKWYASYTRQGVDHMSAMFQSAGGLAALAIRNDSMPLSSRPVPPGSVTRTIKAASGYNPPPEIVNTFTSGLMPRQWLWTGSIAPIGNEDPLAGIGGCSGARPSEGTTVSYREATYTFARTSDAMTSQKYALQVRFDAPNPAFDLYKAPSCNVSYGKPCNRYYYTVISNDKPRAVRCMFNDPGHIYGVSMWIGGGKVASGEVVNLENGLYPVMVEVPLYGQLWTAPRLYEYGNAEYQRLDTEWEKSRADAAGFGGVSTFGSAFSEMKAQYDRSFAAQKIGSNGSVTGGYDPWGAWGVMPSAADMLHCLLPFAQAYRNVTGKDLCAGNNIPMTIPYAMNGGTFYDDYGRDWWRVMGFYDIFPQNLKSQLKSAMDAQDNMGVKLAWHGMFGVLNYPWDGKGGLPLAEEWHGTETVRPALPSGQTSGLGTRAKAGRIFDLNGRQLPGVKSLAQAPRKITSGVFVQQIPGCHPNVGVIGGPANEKH